MSPDQLDFVDAQPADSHDLVARVRSSALWAAYGDALGFISELTDEAGLKRRTKGRPLERPIGWSRLIGGRTGAVVNLPPGCYSDDTQLRLASARAIDSNGFDVEAFAKVELPVWPAYALGGGRATKAAASNLARVGSSWYANRYSGWTDAGGNGAAMRIQPHVWGSPTVAEPSTFLPDVLRNVVCTHSHPVGIAGAVLHAVTLGLTLVRGTVQEPGGLIAEAIAVLHDVPNLMKRVPEVAEMWLTLWERETNAKFQDAWTQSVDNIEKIVATLKDVLIPEPTAYPETLQLLDLFQDQRRGDATRTALAATVLPWAENNVLDGLAMAANALGSDTDTIATMAGAIYGAAGQPPPLPESVLDHDVIVREADRLSSLALGGTGGGHQYPDLLKWSPPQVQADALVSVNEHLEVVGLGPAREIGAPVNGQRPEFLWQWVKLEWGQTLLIKRRRVLPKLRSAQRRLSPPKVEEAETVSLDRGSRHQRRLISEPTSAKPTHDPVDLDRLMDYVMRHDLRDEVVGKTLRALAEKGSRDQFIAFAALLRERLARSRP